jgi:transcriptional regulator of acetoin/glycerol metabolism
VLRVLQEREVVPVGGTQPIAVDIQVVAASHHDLAERVERDLFRRDLYARLAAFTLRMPALRDRREDLGLLLAALLPADVRITPAAAHALVDHDWPLNIRELASCLVVATALARGGPIRLEHLPEAIGGGPAIDVATALSPDEQRKRDELVGLLREHRGNVSAIARVTKKARAQVHRWLRRYDLDPESFR